MLLCWFVYVQLLFPVDYYYYENYYNHTDAQDYASELSVQHNHGTEGTEHDFTEESQMDTNIPSRVNSTEVAEGGGEENLIQNSQVINLWRVLWILKPEIH